MGVDGKDCSLAVENIMKDYGGHIPRRDFIIKSAFAFGAISICGCSPAKRQGIEVDEGMIAEYYLSRKRKLLEGFDDLKKHALPLLASSYSEEFARALEEDATRQFEALIPRIPYVGGDENELTQEIIQSAMALGLYKAMKDHDKAVEETGELLYRTVEAMVNSYPRFLTRVIGLYHMSSLGQKKTKKASLESQKKQYPQNWVYSFIERDGENFDWGVDYSECGIVKFFHSQDADELAPYMCLADFPMSEAFGMGLVRTTTIAEGAEKCDFRFKRGRETQKAWPPKFLEQQKE